MENSMEREVKPYGPEDTVYREFHIGRSMVSYMPSTDWHYAHDDYDGAEDANDTRCGYAPSLEAAKSDIDEWWFDQELARVKAATRQRFADMHDETIAMVKAVVGID
jgi:hypothetical protein